MAQKRPQPAPLLDGQVAVNINTAEPGMFFKTTDGSLTKAGPVCVNTTGYLQSSGPHSDNTVNLGSPTLRFANIYTGDLHLRNDRGDWTMIEEEDYLSLRNNKTGTTFRLVMEEVSG